jgi:aryl-alcohol dehydrogenase-like predicted oxidoreductase
MKMNRLGRSNVLVSEFCLGTMMFGGKTPKEEAIRIVHRAVEAGVNFIDTADCYTEGRAEQITGEAIAAIRDQVVLASKVGVRVGKGPNDMGASRYHIMRGVEASLRRLGTDRLDLLYIHWPFQDLVLEETLRTFEDLVRTGKVLYLGCSNFPAWLMTRSLWIQDVRGYLPFIAGQYPYNLIERGLEVEMLQAAVALGIGMVTYRPLCTGLLTGKYLDGAPEDSRGTGSDQASEWAGRYAGPVGRLVEFAKARDLTPADVAIGWVRGARGVTSPIVGISRMDQLEANLAGFEWTISEQEWQELAEIFPTAPAEAAWGSFPSWRRSYEIMTS